MRRAPLFFGLFACMLASCAHAQQRLPAPEIAEMFGVFDVMCVESAANPNDAYPPLAQLIQSGVARPISYEDARKINASADRAWQFTLGKADASHRYLLLHTDIGLCALMADHGSASDTSETLRHMVTVFARRNNVTDVGHTKKPLAGQPEIQFEAYQFTIPGMRSQTLFSLSTTDKPVRSMRHTLAYQAAKQE